MIAFLHPWADHYLGILANYSQFFGGATLIGGVFSLYMHHRCFHCKRIARFKVGDHQVPVCHRHRPTEESA